VAPVALNPEVPLRLQDVINNCLEKDRELRYQEAASLRADLKRVKRDLESGAASVAVTGSAPVATATPSASSGARTTISVPIGTPSPSNGTGVPRSGGSRNIWVAAGLAAVVLAGGASWLLRDAGDEPRQVAAVPIAALEPVPAPPAAAPAPAAASPVPPAAPPEVPAVDREERARLEAAVTEASRLTARGDLARASEVLNRARAIDPAAPEVSAASAQLVEAYRLDAEATRRLAADRARAEANRSNQAQSPAPASPPRRAQAEPAAAPPQPVVTAPQADATPPPVVAPVPTPRAEPPPVSAPAVAPRVEVAAERRAPAASPAVEDDDAAIRRVVLNYARAIETKDLVLFRSVKPNLSADEQRRLDAGFRAVTSQRVSIVVESIEKRGQEAVVRLRRHDVIQAGGRQQTADSQQTLTFTHASGAWVIRDIR
jgi:hypothetical protein